MSLIEQLSNLYITGKNSLGDMLLSLPEDCQVGMASDRSSTASDEAPNHLTLPTTCTENLSQKFQELYGRVRLETLEGRQLRIYSMPPAQELVYLHNTVELFLRRQMTYTSEEMESPERRDALVDWLVDLHHQSQFKLETLHQCISLVDGFFACRNIQPDSDRLLGVTAMWIAIKLEETKRPKLQKWLQTLPENFSPDSIITLQAEVLKCFKFDLDRPTSFSFLEILTTYFSLTEAAYSLCCYLLELTLLDSRFGAYHRSLLATASLFVSLKVLDPTQWDSAVLLIVAVNGQELLECANDLLKLHQKVQRQDPSSCCNRYSSREKYRVARIKFWPPLE